MAEIYEGFISLFTPEAMVALAQVIMIDLVLAGDNAIVIGLAAAGLPPHQRTKAIVIGVAAATILRLAFAGVTTQLLQIVGLLLAGGILLLWVSWKMWREIHHSKATEHSAATALAGEANSANGTTGNPEASPQPRRKTLGQAAWQIIVADISMSLDNVLAVAGAAKDHPHVLVFGLVLSIVLMGVAAGFIAKLLNRHRWIAYVGLAVILYVALEMIYRGALEVEPGFKAIMGM